MEGQMSIKKKSKLSEKSDLRQTKSKTKQPIKETKMAKKKTVKASVEKSQENSGSSTYTHPTFESPMRPEVGTQPNFKKKKAPATYRYDSSLSPTLEWDGNPAREEAEKLIAKILEAKNIDEAKEAAFRLKAMTKPFLNWSGKAERLSFDVPTLPLFIHERLSTKAIIDTIKDRKRQGDFFDILHQQVKRPATEQIIKAYEHRDRWVNRLVLGDSLAVMNSFLEYEGLGGNVQMIYMDPPYGISYGSNFQPFVRKRDVKHNDDTQMTREPEAIQAYRDTWTLGVHTWLTYLRDRVLLSRELLSDSGSFFLQINEENLHHAHEILNEVFGEKNFVSLITFRKKNMPFGAATLERMSDYIIWYAKDIERLKYRKLFVHKDVQGASRWDWADFPNGETRRLTNEEWNNHKLLPEGTRVFRHGSLKPSGFSEAQVFDVKFKNKIYRPPYGGCWTTTKEGIDKLISLNRIAAENENLMYKLYLDDYPVMQLNNLWSDTSGESDKIYAVQTMSKVVQRCILMSTDPGDLVIDPTCGSGTTAAVAEEWGRRWITIDSSRVPLALAKQRLLTNKYPYFKLSNETNGPSSGFVYERKKNRFGQEIGGIVPHITLGSIVNSEKEPTEILYDRPEIVGGVTRVTGPFVFEATIPTPVDYDSDGVEDSKTKTQEEYDSFTDRMLEILKRSPVLRLEKGKEIKLKDIRKPTKTLALSAEATSVNGKDRKIAILFGPENGAVSHKAVFSAIREAQGKSYEQLLVIGFTIEPNARTEIEQAEQAYDLPAFYVQATPDLVMNDLLKTMRSSQIFSVCGLPEIKIKKHKSKSKSEPDTYQVTLLGLDTFDPTEMETISRKAEDVPAWFLDTDYNNLVFHVDQAFFPKTGAWDNLKKSLKGVYEDEVWDHLSGVTSAPFEVGEQDQIAVKVIDERGNELMIVKSLKEAQ